MTIYQEDKRSVRVANNLKLGIQFLSAMTGLGPTFIFQVLNEKMYDFTGLLVSKRVLLFLLIRSNSQVQK